LFLQEKKSEAKTKVIKVIFFIGFSFKMKTLKIGYSGYSIGDIVKIINKAGRKFRKNVFAIKAGLSTPKGDSGGFTIHFSGFTIPLLFPL
jgi:hypothetical protein